MTIILCITITANTFHSKTILEFRSISLVNFSKLFDDSLSLSGSIISLSKIAMIYSKQQNSHRSKQQRSISISVIFFFSLQSVSILYQRSCILNPFFSSRFSLFSQHDYKAIRNVAFICVARSLKT